MKKIVLIVFLFVLVTFDFKVLAYENLKIGDYKLKNSNMAADIIDETNYLSIAYIDKEDNLSGFITYSPSNSSTKKIRIGSFSINYFDYVIDYKEAEEDPEVMSYVVVAKDGIEDFCNKYDELKDASTCKAVNDVNNKIEYHFLVLREWKLSDVISKLECDSDVFVGEEIKCDFYLDFKTDGAAVIFRFNNDNIDIVDIVPKTGYISDVYDEDSYVVDGETSDLKYDDLSSPLFTVTLKPNDDYNGTLDLNYYYYIPFYFASSEAPLGDYFDEINVKVNVLRKNQDLESPYILKCTNSSLKKGSTANCVLSVNAISPIKKIKIDFDTSKYVFEKVEGTSNWELSDSVSENDKNIYTLVNEKGFKGNSEVLKFTIKFEEDLLSGFVVTTSNILYTLTSDVEFKAVAKDILVETNSYISKPENSKSENNPNTNDLIIDLMITFIISFGVIWYLRKQRISLS